MVKKTLVSQLQILSEMPIKVSESNYNSLVFLDFPEKLQLLSSQVSCLSVLF